MARKPPLSIRAAVMHCLARCEESKAPLCSLREFLEKLRAINWDEQDIHTIEQAVLLLLGKVDEVPGEPQRSESA